MSALIMAISSIFIATAHHHNMGFFPLLKRQADFHCFLWDKALSSVEECLPVSCDRPHSPLAFCGM